MGDFPGNAQPTVPVASQNHQPVPEPSSYYGNQANGGGTISLVLILIGIVMILVGKLVLAVTVKVDSGDAEENLLVATFIFGAIGGALAAMGLTWGALRGTEFSNNIRVGLIIAAGIVIGFYCTGGVSLLNLLRYL